MIAVAVAVAAYIIGLLIFYVWGAFSTGWYEYYYVWDKGKDFLIFIAMYRVVNKRLKRVIKPVIIFTSIRFLWQLISSVTGLDINTPKITDYLFIILASVCGSITLKELYKWHTLNGR